MCTLLTPRGVRAGAVLDTDPPLRGGKYNDEVEFPRGAKHPGKGGNGAVLPLKLRRGGKPGKGGEVVRVDGTVLPLKTRRGGKPGKRGEVGGVGGTVLPSEPPRGGKPGKGDNGARVDGTVLPLKPRRGGKPSKGDNGPGGGSTAQPLESVCCRCKSPPMFPVVVP